MDAKERLLAALPDEARFVDLRGLLGRRGARVWAAEDASWGLVRTDALHLISVHGRPPATALHLALAGRPPPPDLFVPDEYVALLRTLVPGWRERSGVLMVLSPGRTVHAKCGHRTRLLDAADASALAHVEPPLREELLAALTAGPVAAALDGALPVAFCYAHHRTDSWWDVSIDTLASHRRRGFGAAASVALIKHLRSEALEPVWGALEPNYASWATALSLGFLPEALFSVLSPPAAG